MTQPMRYVGLNALTWDELHTFKERLQDWQSNGDIEASHAHADGILCDLLIKIGLEDVVDEWRKIEKWYA